MSKSETFVIPGKVFWARLDKPNDLSGKYQMDLSVDEGTAELLKSKGVKIKKEDNETHLGTDNDRGNYVTLKKSFQIKDRTTGQLTTLAPPALIDGKRNPVPTGTLLGNGSLVNVETNVFDWSFQGKKGKGLGLGTVQIRALIKYENKSLDQFPIEKYVHEQKQDLDDKDISF